MANLAHHVAQQWQAWADLPRERTGLAARPGQREMSEAIAAAMDDQRALMVEAGTGTGKSLAYLLPAVLSGRRVVIATATKALQDQLVARELPRLWSLGLEPVPYQVLKGVANYVCQRRYHLAALAARTRPEVAAQLEDIRAWHGATATGEVSEVTWRRPGDQRWREITTTADARLGARCPYSSTCFVAAARRGADKARLIFVNHALYFADLSLRRRGGGAGGAGAAGRVVPDHDVVIFDEAHALHDVATEHFTHRLQAAEVFDVWRRARQEATPTLFTAVVAAPDAARADAALPLIAACEQGFAQLFEAYGRRARGLGVATADRVEMPSGFMQEGELQQAYYALDTALERFLAWSEAFVAARGGGAELGGATQVAAVDAGAGALGHQEAIAALGRRAAQLREDLALLHEQRDPAYVFWLEAGRGGGSGGGVSIGASPIDVREVLGRYVVRQPQATPIFTSATFTVQRSFGFVRERWGVTADDASELVLDSPFDYGRQALLYIARDLPPPGPEPMPPAVVARLRELLAITDGHAFVLFTSHRALAAAAAALRGAANGTGDHDAATYPLFVQGESPSSELLERFRATPRAVLLGTGQFWEGVDVPGQALSHVIIDRLPFSPPTEPVAQARARRAEERGEDPFTTLALPEAALALRQGMGRLIRAAADRGLISVLDPRLVTKQYGRVFIESLPPQLGRTSILDQARRWWLAPRAATPAATTTPAATPTSTQEPTL